MLLRMPWLSGKEGKIGMKEKEKDRAFPEDVVKCFNTFACLSEGGENDNEVFPLVFVRPGFRF